MIEADMNQTLFLQSLFKSTSQSILDLPHEANDAGRSDLLSPLPFPLLRLFDGFHATKIVPYSLILQADAETAEILQNAPSWMQWSNDGRPNPLPSNAPPWLEWQSKTFLVSYSPLT